MDEKLKEELSNVANTIRQLSIDAIQRANSGHPGLPLGCAEIGAYLWGHALRYNPLNPSWINRDRFILSAGHGSMLLYSCLHLAGYNISIDDIKEFRQYHSKTPGHPEFGVTEGVEASTGPLGQGVGNAVGQALGLKILAEKFNTKRCKIFDAKVFALCGDGCIMEGVTSEVSSLAGHLNLDNLVVIYDSNHFCLDGPLSECCSENVLERYHSYGWNVYEINGHDLNELDYTISGIKKYQDKPSLICAQTIIGKGSPNKAGTNEIHGSPLGEEEVIATKEALNLSMESFFVPQSVYSFFENRKIGLARLEEEWHKVFYAWSDENPKLSETLNSMRSKVIDCDLEEKLNDLNMKNTLSGRSASQEVISALAPLVPQLYGGSADLSCSDKTLMEQYDLVFPNHFLGRNIKYGVREFGMGTISLGLAQTGMFIPFCGTFLVFSDYMRSAIRMAALSKIKVIYQFTHDSIFIGEDGPSHQPIEHLMSLRAIPDLHVIRPADNNEVKMAWIAALKYQGPTAIILSRQALKELTCTKVSYCDGVGRGAYIVKKEKSKPDFTFFATGSELSLALDVAEELEHLDKSVRVISMPCWELFEKQSNVYKESVVDGDLGHRVSIEAGSGLGWYKYIGRDGIAVCMEDFGISAPHDILSQEYDFSVEAILSLVLTKSM